MNVKGEKLFGLNLHITLKKSKHISSHTDFILYAASVSASSFYSDKSRFKGRKLYKNVLIVIYLFYELDSTYNSLIR